MKYLIIAVVFTIVLAGCEEEKPQAEKDDEIINNYLSDNNREAVNHSSGMYYEIIAKGSGGHPAVTDTVIVKYKGYLTNNQVFDETTGDDTFTYPLSGLIPGWQIGVPLIQKGGKEIIYIPSALGYGSYSTSTIPANSVLIFEIELVDFY